MNIGDKAPEILGKDQDGNEIRLSDFAGKQQLPFPLIADTDHKLQEKMGVWGEKSMCGRKYMGTFRTTFLIDGQGVITHVFGPKAIKTKEHASQILAL